MLQGIGFVQMICSKGLADRSSLARGANGSGPYTLVSAVPGDHYTFQVRKNYTWGPGGSTTATNGLPAKVTLKVVTNETTQANLVLTGGLNLATYGTAIPDVSSPSDRHATNAAVSVRTSATSRPCSL